MEEGKGGEGGGINAEQQTNNCKLINPSWKEESGGNLKERAAKVNSVARRAGGRASKDADGPNL